MRVQDIWEELKELSGSCEDSVNYRALTRAVEELSVSGLFDPQIGTVTINVSEGHLVVLPRDVKAVIRVNIDNNPSFSRSRIFEFELNTDGSQSGDESGWQWHDRGFARTQKIGHAPTKVKYVTSTLNDNTKTIAIWGINEEGREVAETLIGLTTGAAESIHTYAEFTYIHREATTQEASLVSTDTDIGTIGRYYADEEEPEYRVIKLSKTGVAAKVRYRRKTFKLTSQDDIIPINSPMAVLRAFNAVRLMMQQKYELADPVMVGAIAMLRNEQASRDEGVLAATETEIQTSINRGINANNVVIVADIYDDASSIFGPIGREKLFDRITDSVEALQNVAPWDSTIGVCDLNKNNFCDELNLCGGTGHGLFTLPRYVHSVMAINVNGRPGIPRNRWFEFHLNGTGETDRASGGTWDDLGEVATINRIPIRLMRTSPTPTGPVVPTFDSTVAFTFDGTIFPSFDMQAGTTTVGAVTYKIKVVPCMVIARPENSLDENKIVRVYGIEEKADGTHVEVYRDGARGWLCPCKANGVPTTGSPKFVRIDRITRQATSGFVTFETVANSDAESVRLGYWYPDELEPRYNLIKVPQCKEARIRIRYKKATYKITSLDDVLNLRSRLAIKNMMLGVAKQDSDPSAAEANVALAVRYLTEEQRGRVTINHTSLQFDPATCPGFTGNIQ